MHGIKPTDDFLVETEWMNAVIQEGLGIIGGVAAVICHPVHKRVFHHFNDNNAMVVEWNACLPFLVTLTVMIRAR